MLGNTTCIGHNFVRILLTGLFLSNPDLSIIPRRYRLQVQNDLDQFVRTQLPQGFAFVHAWTLSILASFGYGHFDPCPFCSTPLPDIR